MKKFTPVCWFIISMLAVSCTYSTPKPNITPEATIILKSSLPPPDHSFRSRWEMVDQPINDDSSSIIVYAIKLTGQNIIVISSIPSSKIDEISESKITIQMRDNIGDAKLLSRSSLFTLGNVNFWVMEFEARNIGANEIFLSIGESESDENSFIQIAKFVDPPEDPTVHSGRTYMIGSNQFFEQDDYRISFEGWVPPPSIITMPSTWESAENAAISDNATIRIESLSTGKINYLSIQFLSNGEIKCELIQ